MVKGHGTAVKGHDHMVQGHEVMHVCGSFMGGHEERGARIGYRGPRGHWRLVETGSVSPKIRRRAKRGWMKDAHHHRTLPPSLATTAAAAPVDGCYLKLEFLLGCGFLGGFCCLPRLRISGNYYCRNSSSSSGTSCSSMLFWVSLGGKQDHHVLQGRTFELRFFSLHREIYPSSRRNRRPRETVAS
ncbi:unnamed protein product [Sphagnum jensenii]|uniref:Uncharacterized protein n=1 Tax=Sphagnum jensenii TaxID=128206 RepID=A0ABP1AM45_9BRYO